MTKLQQARAPTTAAFLAESGPQLADLCTACGACFQACPMAEHVGLRGADIHAVTQGLRDLARGQPGAAETVTWVGACAKSGLCVEACPEHAIQWDQRGALIITDACTGCGACVPACPYDAVELVPIGRQNGNLMWGLWDRLQKMRNPIIPLEAAKPTQRASKCDLCHGFDNLACVNACPTGALRLMSVEDVMAL